MRGLSGRIVQSNTKMHPGIDPEMIITKLPYKVMDQLVGYLDIPDGSNKPYWKALITVLPDDMYTDVQINRLSMEALRLGGGSSSLSLLRDLGNRCGKTVRQLAAYLDKLHYEEPLLLIKSPEPLEMRHQPVSQSVVEGEVAKFTCKAKGFPYPRYQWYRAFTQVEGGDIKYEEAKGEADATLSIHPVALEDAGGYCCKVYHMPGGQETSMFTEWAYLTVLNSSGGPYPSNSTSLHPYAPPVIRQQPEAEMRVHVGGELRMTCKASGCPAPQYQWYKYDEDPKTGESVKQLVKGCESEVLEFAQATATDKGRYECHAYNSKGDAWSVTVSVTVETMMDRARRPVRIEILRHPVDVLCALQMPQKVECVACCASAKLCYQWYKDDVLIEDETDNQLCFQSFKMADAGTYFCRVTADNGQYVDSELAQLKVPSPTIGQVCTATDKVALLIGNEDYRTGERLVAPGKDMSKLAAKLSSEPMYFKVVSLLDLTLKEMRKALDIFCSLLNEGVYGVFYFSGHGFEHDGQTYMVPNDAPTGYLPEDCMCAQEVLEKMQCRDTALNVILLDICRKFNDSAQGPVEKHEPKVKGNTVFGYAAQCNSEAYEVKSAGYAIFTRYLVKRIHEQEPIFSLLSKILTDVKQDPDAGNKQFPALMGDLNENRTLVDGIIYKGHTDVFNSRQDKWEKAHALSQDTKVTFSLGIEVHVTFECRFSNYMIINLLVANKGASMWCVAELGYFPPGLDIEVVDEQRTVQLPDGQIEVKMFRITKVKNVQRLRDNLLLRLIVRYMYQGQQMMEEAQIPVDRPLIADVWLMDEPLERSPTENEEYPNSTVSSTNSLLD